MLQYTDWQLNKLNEIKLRGSNRVSKRLVSCLKQKRKML